MSTLRAIALVALGLAEIAAGLRWLRVAQREHYLAGAPLRFARRWWFANPLVATVAGIGLAAAVAARYLPELGFLVAVIFACGPPGLGLRGRTARLAWTRRLVLIAIAMAGISAAVVVIVALATGLAWAVMTLALLVGLVPIVAELGLLALTPLEDRLARRYVAKAVTVLAQVRPMIVAITGSYGKTSTKGYAAHLLAGRFNVVASPRSFNNRAGLARTVNELLVLGTDVLIGEMGAYGPGEIAALCAWLPPKVAVITAIGPVHLERFRTLERTLAAKAEITAGAETTVLNVDDERLAGLARDLRAAGREVVRCSAVDVTADVALLTEAEGYRLHVSGTFVGEVTVPPAARVPALTNLACAVGVAIALGCAPQEILARLAGVPTTENRLQLRRTAAGATVLDDTFNSNPAGARLALAALAEHGGARRVVITPGMVELGHLQVEENARFAALASAVATDVIVVGRTNRRALAQGLADGGRRATLEVPTREQAVEWVRSELGPDDIVLYENDLPDHYP
jgi:UDP-N-acetylmuramoyl-tripeptide--D-alanyl-D-alanine ligase